MDKNYNIYNISKINTYNTVDRTKMMIFQSSDDNNRQSQIQQQQGNRQETRTNLFMLSEQQKSNLNKRLPRGFFLIRKQQYDKLGYMKKSTIDNIIYEPVKIQRTGELDNPIVNAISQAWKKKQEQMRKSNRFTLQYTLEGRSRQSQKIKNIIQRFRKLIKNTNVEIFLNKLGYMMALNQIQAQNKKGLLTIDTFKARYMVVLETAKNNSFETEVIAQTQQMIEQFLCYVEQARKIQFENNIQAIQKSIDKITRYLSETSDAKTQGNWYIKKKKKSQKNQNCTQKQILYFGQLIQRLPMAYLIGIWEIINQRPFIQAQKNIEHINLLEISSKKLREIQYYVKSKLSQMYRSRERKKQKMQAKRIQKYGNANINTKERVNKQSVPQEKEQGFRIKAEPNIQDLEENVNQNAFDDIFVMEERQEVQKQKQRQRDNIDELIDGAIFGQPSNNNNNQKVKIQGTVKNQYVQNKGQYQEYEDEEYDSSDSSMITDQEQSDF